MSNPYSSSPAYTPYFPNYTPTDSPSLPNLPSPDTTPFTIRTDKTSPIDSSLVGLSYPLSITPDGSINLSANTDRIEQQILEVLDTRIGERIMIQELGTYDYVFEALSEEVISVQVQRTLETFIRNTSFQVDVAVNDFGECNIIIFYAYKGGLTGRVGYTYRGSRSNNPQYGRLTLG